MAVKRLKTLDGVHYTMNEVYYSILKEGYNRALQKFDNVILVTGSVGSGKTNIEIGLGGCWQNEFLKKPFSLDNIHFKAETITERTNLLDNKMEFLGYDEAIQGGSGRDGNSRVGKIFRKALVTKRTKRHFLVCCVDSLKELNDKLIERSFVWIHVYTTRDKKGKYRRGRTKIFNKKQAIIVWDDLKQKKVIDTEDHYIFKQKRITIDTMNYMGVWFNEEDYDKKKSDETNLLDTDNKSDKVMLQRNRLIKFCLDNGFKQIEVANVSGLGRGTIGDIKAKMSVTNTII
jgi:hypothetical protein